MKLPTDKRLDEIFGIEDEETALVEAAETLPVVYEEPEVDPDIKEQYQGMKDAIGTANELLETMARITVNSEKARDFEVATSLLKTVIDARKNVIEERRKILMDLEMKSAPVKDDAPPTLIVKSTDELLRMLSQAKMERKDA